MGRISVISFMLVLASASCAFSAGYKVSEYGNKHNLRGNAANPVSYKALYDPADRRTDEICIFCHTPHNATPSTPLWGRKQTVVSSFGHYTSTTLVIHINSSANTASGYGEPNYSSRLCLSCHDGATALGAVLYGPEIPFVGGKNTIERVASDYNVFNPGSITGVSGATDDATQHHHPISFKYDDTVKAYLPAGYKYPNQPDGSGKYIVPQVKLDRHGFMQCSTCHNPHQNMSDDDTSTPFWVIGSGVDGATVFDSVCLSCHPTPIPSYAP